MESNALRYFLSPEMGLLINFLIMKKTKTKSIFLAAVKALSHQKWNE